MRLLPFFFLLAAALPGCGGGSATLTGKVSLRGMSLTMGTVTVLSESGEIGTAEIQDDGSYTIENCPKGKIKIAVISPNPAEAERQFQVMKSSGRFQSNPPQQINSRKVDPQKWVEIPFNYGDPDQSGLTTDVSGGENKYDIVMN